MSDDHEQPQQTRNGSILVVIIVLIIAYPLSLGPMSLLVELSVGRARCRLQQQ